MKSKITHFFWLLMLLTAGFAVCSGIYFLVDHGFNGAFLDWFTSNYIRTEYVYLPEEGADMLVQSLAWYELKSLLLAVFIVSTLAWLTVAFAAARIAAGRREKRTITDISRRLRAYMDEAGDGAGVFPKSQGEIADQMAEVKSALLEKERTLQAEASRKNDLVAYLAHDLKTPLTSVIGYLSLLDEAPDMPPQQREKYTRITLEKAYRLEKMTDEFFEIARYNLQQIIIQKEPIDLYYMLVQLTDELLPMLEARGNTVALQADETLTIVGDPDKLARVFNNVLKNAAAYSYANTEIVIAAEEREGAVTIRFTNQGRGIPRERLGAIFEKFYRLDEARASGTGGAGLGLAIAREIVTLHGGAISADSGEGTVTFTVTLPAHEGGVT